MLVVEAARAGTLRTGLFTFVAFTSTCRRLELVDMVVCRCLECKLRSKGWSGDWSELFLGVEGFGEWPDTMATRLAQVVQLSISGLQLHVSLVSIGTTSQAGGLEAGSSMFSEQACKWYRDENIINKL